jgi:hypothetical protein
MAFFSVECSAEPAAVISTLPTASIDYTLDPPGPDLSDTIPFFASTNSGFTIMGKLYHNTVDLYDYASIVHIANLDWTNQLRIYWIPGNQYRILIRVKSLDLDCAEDVPTSVFPVHDAWNSFTWRYDASTQSFEFKSNPQTVTKTCSVGALQDFDIKRARTLNMNWAGMRVYDSVLSDDEMASELDKICVPVDTCADVLTAGCDTAPACSVPSTCSETLISEWKFNNNFADSQGIYPLTATGISFVDGRYGKAATIDNDSDMLRTTNDFSPLTSKSKQTYSFWVKRSQVNDKLHHVFAQSRVRSDGNEWGVYFNPTPSNTLVVYVFGDPGLESATQFSDTNTWNHFIVTVNEGVFSLYQNGILEDTKTMSIGSISGPLYYTPDSILGNIGRFFPRLALDNFRFYNAVLSVSVVAACEASLTASVAPVYSLPPTGKLAYPADNYAQLLTTPIQLQAEANGGFAVLGKFFFVSSDVQPWGKLFQLRNFNLETADALHLQIQIYQSDTAANYRFQIWKGGSSCQEEFAKPATDNAWISVDLQYDTGTDKWELKLNDVLVAQTTCNAGWLENFYLNRVIVASQNWAGLRLYDSLLTDAEVASELDKICVPADTCADVLTAGCDSAPACPDSTSANDAPSNCCQKTWPE